MSDWLKKWAKTNVNVRFFNKDVRIFKIVSGIFD